MKRKAFILLVGAICTFASCGQDADSEIGYIRKVPNIILTPEEYASVAYSGDNELSESEVMELAKRFVRSLPQTKSTDDIQCKIGEKIEVRDAQTRGGESTPVFAYYVQVEAGDREGTALVSADKRAPEVLVYCPQITPINYPSCPGTQSMTEVAKQALLYQIDRCEHLRDSLEEKTLEKVAIQYGRDSVEFADFWYDIYIDNYGYYFPRTVKPEGEITQTVGPFTARTEWDQVYPYNALLDETDLDAFDNYLYRQHYGVGCVTVAGAQIMAAYQPQTVANGVTIDWEYLLESPQVFEDEPEKVRQVASLMWYIGEETHTRYSESGGSTTIEELAAFLKRYGIEMDAARNGLLVSRIKASLDSKRMVIATGTTSSATRGKKPYHAWIIDGYRTTRKNTKEFLRYYNMYVHANMGWGGFDSGYYLVGDDQSLIFDTVESGAFDTDLKMYCNVKSTR